MSQKFKILLFIAFSSSFLTGFAQTPGGGNDIYTNSPYSRIGIGDIAPIGNLRNIGMGGTGVSLGNAQFINSMNPALLINNRVRRYDSLLTIFDASVFGQVRRVSNANASERSGNIGFNSFAYAFPVSKRWTTSIGLNPFSHVSYSIFTQDTVSGSPLDTTLIEYNGYGGVYQAYISNALRITDNLNIGLQVAYLFGSISHESVSQIVTLPAATRVGTTNKTAYTGFLFRPGVAYRKKLQRNVSRDSAIFMNVGFTYDFFGNFQGDERLLLQTRTADNVIISQNKAESNKSNLNFPSTYRFGFSFDKYSKWNIAADFSYTNWSTFKETGQGDIMKDSYSIALGGEIALNPKKGLNERDANLKKSYVRAGINYTKTPFYVNGREIKDFAVTLGYSFAVGNAKKNYSGLPFPLLTTAIVVGERGTHQDNLVKDMYYKLYVGLTINDKWFRRRRVD